MLIQHSLTPGHRPWKKFILTGGALSAAWWPCPPFTWSNSISLALNLFILTLINTPWVKCDKCHTPFHLQCGTWESVYVVRSRCFFAPSFVVSSFRYPYPSLCHLILIDLFSCHLILIDFFSCHLKMARKAKCPDTPKGTKKPGDRGESTH